MFAIANEGRLLVWANPGYSPIVHVPNIVMVGQAEFRSKDQQLSSRVHSLPIATARPPSNAATIILQLEEHRFSFTWVIQIVDFRGTYLWNWSCGLRCGFESRVQEFSYTGRET